MNQHNTFSKEQALHLRVADHSETGRLRDHNADAFARSDLSDSQQAEQACEALVQLANEAAGDENISVILLSFSHISHDGERVSTKSR